MQYIRYHCDSSFCKDSLRCPDYYISSLEVLEQFVESNFLIRIEYNIHCVKCLENVHQFCANYGLNKCFDISQKIEWYPEYRAFTYNIFTISIINNNYLQQYGKFTLTSTSYFDATKYNGGLMEIC
jgi:hypothetical protein